MFRLVRAQEFHREKGPFADMLSEFLGTFMLVLTVGLNVLANSAAGAFSIAASLMCMIYALGNVSGAHFNPAVTAAIFVAGRCTGLSPRLSLATVGKYFLAQFAGGILAALAYSGIREGESFLLWPGEGFGWTQVAAAEALFTFVLCYCVLCVAVSSATKSTAMFGLAIGSCVTIGGNAIGKISGGSLNPAVSAGVSLGRFAMAGGGASAA